MRIAALAGALLILGCAAQVPSISPPVVPSPTTSTAQATPSASPSLTPIPIDEAWLQELDNVGSDGQRSLDSALRLFALAFGPIPGVETSPVAGVIPDATVAVRAIDAHRSELTPDQLAAVDGILAPAADARIVVDPGPSALRPRVVMAASIDDLITATRQLEATYRAQIGSNLGLSLPGTVTMVFQDDTPKLYGTTLPEFQGDAYSACTITFHSAFIHGEPLEITNTVAHELFHCFEAAGGGRNGWVTAQSWWSEGGAEWVGDTVGGPDLSGYGFWTKYLTTPQVQLVTRSYDGEGFFAHLAETGTSPWSVFPAIFKTTDYEAAWLASQANNDNFLDSWPSGLLRQPARGAAWDTNGPGITDDAATPEELAIANGDEQDVDVIPFANALWSLTISADVLQVGALGHARISDGSVDEVVTSAAFCTKDGGCPPCPEGSVSPQLPQLGQSAVFALTGADTGGSALLTGTDLSTWCQPPPQPSPTRSGDLCALFTSAEIGAILGRSVGEGHGHPVEPGKAGTCQWDANDGNGWATISAGPASGPTGNCPDPGHSVSEIAYWNCVGPVFAPPPAGMGTQAVAIGNSTFYLVQVFAADENAAIELLNEFVSRY